MAAQTLDVFALTVYRDSISLAPEEKAAIVAHILQQAEEPATVTPKLAGMAWTGDKKGHEFLFRDPLFANLSRKVGDRIWSYVEMLGIDSAQADFFLQRSWATVTRRSEQIAPPRHVQPNISFAYHPLKPENSGDIRISVQEVPEEVIAAITEIAMPRAAA